MAGESNLSSLLAQSKSRTDAAISGVKKQNRRARQARIVGAGLELYDSFSKGKAKKRADEFFSTAMPMVDEVINNIDDAAAFFNNHNTVYGEGNDTWEDMFFQKEAEVFLKSKPVRSIGDQENQTEGGRADRNQNRINAVANEMQSGEGPLGTTYIDKLESYKELYNIYNSPEFAQGNIGVSDDSRSRTKKTIKASYEASIRKTYDELRSRGGVLPDLLARFGIEPKYEDVYYTAEKVIQIPPNLSQDTNNYLTSLRNSVAVSDQLDEITGRFYHVDNNPLTNYFELTSRGSDDNRLSLVDVGFSGFTEDPNVTAYFKPAENATAAKPYQSLIDKLRNSYFTSDGSSVDETFPGASSLNNRMTLFTRGADGVYTKQTNNDNAPLTFATILETATPPQQEVIVMNVQTGLNGFVTAIDKTIEALKDTEGLINQDGLDQLLNLKNSPTLMMEVMFNTIDYRDVLGIENNPNAQGGLDVLRLNPNIPINRDRAGQYYMGLELVQRVTGLEIGRNLTELSNTLEWSLKDNSRIQVGEGLAAVLAATLRREGGDIENKYRELTGVDVGTVRRQGTYDKLNEETNRRETWNDTIGTVTPLTYEERLRKKSEEDQARVSKISELTDTYKLSPEFLRQLEEGSVDPDQIENSFVTELADKAVLQMESTGLLSPMSWTSDPKYEYGMSLSEYLVLGTPEKITEKINNVIGYQARLAVQNSQDKEGITTLTTSIKDALRVSLEEAIELLKAKEISSSGLFEGDNLTPDEEINVLGLWIQRL
jgi:hypothetical protein